jgi:hypothetical protein
MVKKVNDSKWLEAFHVRRSDADFQEIELLLVTKVTRKPSST